MTYIPHGPLWCWVLQGEDQLFLSQPTVAWAPWVDGGVLALTDRVACTRCQHETRFCLDDQPYNLDTGAGLTPPVQCGRVASLDRRGRWLCDFHMLTYWECYHCRAPVPDGEGGFCTPACHADYLRAVEEDSP
jgi:hypothetical protein